MKKRKIVQVKWGIFNTMKKEFQFGIAEDTADLALHKLFEKIGKDAYKWRFTPRRFQLVTEVDPELEETLEVEDVLF